jgi:hypothetical protein
MDRVQKDTDTGEKTHKAAATPAADEALSNTARPEPSQDRVPSHDGVGAGPQTLDDTNEEADALRTLGPRSVKRQFGQDADVEPTADQEAGTKEWYHESKEMKDSFPDTDDRNKGDGATTP